MPPQVIAAVNELAGKLGYLPVDEEWGSPGRPADLRDPATIKGASPSPGTLPGDALVAGSGVLEQWLRSRLDSAGEQVASRWESCAAAKFQVVSRAVTGGSEAQWVVDITARTVTPDDGRDEDVAWSVLAYPETWQAVQARGVNLMTALRRSDLRYCAAGEDSPESAQTRVAMLADLLGLSSRERAEALPEDTAAPATAVAL
jgi:hypothetical protein